MWERKLLGYLAEKACPSESVRAVKFAHELVNLLEIKYLRDETGIIFLGVIKDLFIHMERGFLNGTLQQFAEEVIGLFILHTKFHIDECVWNDDLKDLLEYEIIFDALATHKIINGSILSVIHGTSIELLNRIEREIYARLNHKVFINPLDLQRVFGQLLMEIPNPSACVSDMYSFFISFTQKKGEEFIKFLLLITSIPDQLIINKICKQLEGYASNAKEDFKVNFFCCERRYGHTHQVAEIVADIQQKELRSVSEIIRSLDEIKVCNPKDELRPIVDSLKKQYPQQKTLAA
jgi:hypothetical protein